MQRYFLKELNLSDHVAEITGSDVHHIRNVMRFVIGDRIIVNSYEGRVFQAIIEEISKTSVTCRLVEEIPSDYRPLKLTLAMALIKKDRFELVLQKATELGVMAIMPLSTERSIVKIHDFEHKLERYETIIKEASEQSERPVLTNMMPLTDLNEIDFDRYDHVIVAYEREYQEHSLSKMIKNISHDENVLVIIGPEGGFSESEIDALKQKPVKFASLGKTILRAETAAIYAASAFKYIWEN